MTVSKVLVALLVLWVLMGIVGFFIKALFFLFVIALIAFGFTLATEGRRRGILKR